MQQHIPTPVSQVSDPPMYDAESITASNEPASQAPSPAIETKTQRIISCIVAIAKVILAKVVCMMPRSMKIFEITGIDVIARATVITSFKDKILFCGPIIFSKSKK